MPRYKLTIEYDGRPYCGWQRQANGWSVQAAIEAAVLAFAGEERTLFGAGRTDAGVHASGQVAHLDLTRDWAADTVRDALNAHLREEATSILSVEAVPESFDARFTAFQRHYLYRILNRRPPAALLRGQVWWVWKPLDVAAMDRAAKRLLGTHDFTTFRSTHCQAKNPVRTLERLDVLAAGDEVHIRASAQSFLHNQIRSFAGSLKLIGEGRWTDEDLVAALGARDRKRCGPVAPPDGLYLTEVEYRPGATLRRFTSDAGNVSDEGDAGDVHDEAVADE
ncbi:tRNA pseudouridine(38-40) synthase TruA [Aurantimonas sp. MSK8Z-1]|uniref:tRNA pseudouridine(38-40) synthase TruA n=1 Tax=Mangrovibrevibacter kandeliae TaxID=2968473 RepID=UPI0021195848|nr:tRNA pseudouridine(38-40) synthase TruA [Aurantimonas sp. MSK8Z-1]MCW4116028.1 tRNA pseudouridine(38-40) synthase TruA [Aurantimonas sp. MSK8Z-1]